MNRHAIVSTRIGDLTLAGERTSFDLPTALHGDEFQRRVVGRNGSLTGYAGGLGRKQFLLDLEEPVTARLF
jgi:O6-methylguanine-DNA--protein-cysteine methyltransferase